MLRFAVASLAVLHGLIHLFGVVKAFELAPLAQLTAPISRPMGLLWLAAALLMVASAVMLFVAPRWFAWVAAMAVMLSQVVIVASWNDARFGTVANVLLLAAAAYAALASGPLSARG